MKTKQNKTKKKKKFTVPIRPIYGESFVHCNRKWGIKGAIIMALNPKSFNQEIRTKSSRPEIHHIFSIIVKKGRHIWSVFSIGPWRPPSILKLRKSSYKLNCSINVTNPLSIFLLDVNFKKLTIWLHFLFISFIHVKVLED